MLRTFGLCSALIIMLALESGALAQARTLGVPSILWNVNLDSPTNGDPLVTNGLVIVGTERGLLQAFRAEDGSEAWHHEHGQHIYYRPDSDANAIYFTSAKGITAVSRSDGSQLWNYPISHGAGPCLAVAPHGLIIATGYDGSIYAVDARTGEWRWSTDLLPPDGPPDSGKSARLGDAPLRPGGIACDGDIVYQSIFDESRLVALQASTGDLLWSYHANGWIFGAPTFTKDRVFIGSQDCFLHCLDKQTGTQLWKFKTGNRIECAGTVDESSIYFASCDGSLYRVNQADGKQIWKFDTKPDYKGIRAIYSTPVLMGAAVYFAAGEGTVYAVDQESGKLKWQIRAAQDSQTFCSPAADDRRLFVVTRPDWDKRGESSLIAITHP